MPDIGQLWRRCIFLFKRNRMDRELAEEIRQHLELKAQKNLVAGMSPEQARSAAKRQFGNLTHMEEESRRTWGFPLLGSLLQDVRYGGRALRKAPAFTAAAVVTLALGIGATTAIFSIVNALLLRPLPYKDSSRIVHVWSTTAMFPDLQTGQSKLDFDDIKASVHSFEGLALYRQKDVSLTGAGEPEQISAVEVASEFLPLFGIRPAIGRAFRPDDEQVKSGNVVLLGHGLWQRRFNADTNIVGKPVTLDQKPYTVAGVLPPGFDFPGKTDALVPLVLTAEDQGNRGNRFFFMLGRVRTGIPMAAGQTELDDVAKRLAAAYPKENSGLKLRMVPLQQETMQNAKSGLLLLLGGVSFLLLIACANVSNLILARGVQRQREIAVRAALGASRARVLRQLLMESLLLSFLGGAAGLLVAIFSIDAFRAFAPDIPRLVELRLEPMVGWFGLIISSLAGILCGLAPALHTSRSDLNFALKDRTSAAPSAAGHQRFSLRGFLVVSEVALALMLLTGSALMVQSMARLLHVDPGFRTDHILTAEINLPEARYPSDDVRRVFVQRLLETLHGQPQLSNAALSNSPTLTSNLTVTAFDPGTLGLSDTTTALESKSVSPDFFGTLGIRLLSGRLFTERDTKGSTHVAIINQSLARRYFSAQDPVGKTLKLGPDPDDQFQIIGVVADTRDVHLSARPRPQIYFSIFQGTWASIHILIRTGPDPLALVPGLQHGIWSLDKDEPISKIQSMDHVVSQSVAEPRFRAGLLSAFAAVGLALTLIGIYGVISYTVSQRTQEIGIRIALGAQPGNVIKLVLGQGTRLAVTGAAIGVLGSLAIMRLLRSELFEIKPGDPMTLTGAAVVMLAVALVASYVPARRAAKVDPMIALRNE